MPQLSIDRRQPAPGPTRQVTVWDSTMLGAEEAPACHQWVSKYLGGAYRLVRVPEERFKRPVDRALQRDVADGEPAFADALPFLVVSQQSIDGLRAKLPRDAAACADARRFRPNIVVDGAYSPNEEVCLLAAAELG